MGTAARLRTAIIVVYSGGMDSFTLLHKAIQKQTIRYGGQKSDIYPISFDYGQRHKKELYYADRVVRQLELEFNYHIVRLDGLAPLLRGSALTSPRIAVPEGHYAADSMKQTVVPGRNTIMLSIAMGYAESLLNSSMQYDNAEVWYGAHSGDHHIYPDCRPGFVTGLTETFLHATEGRVKLRAPFLYLDKAGILKLGLGMGLNYAQSWTCYKGEAEPCGKCGSCVEREEAFTKLAKYDPALDPLSEPFKTHDEQSTAFGLGL